MMAKSEDARLIFMKDSHALQTLTKLLHSYIQLDSLVNSIEFFSISYKNFSFRY